MTPRVGIDGGSVVLLAWLLMLALGDIHLDIARQCPHPGFLLTLAACFALGLLVTLLRRGLDVDE